MLIVFTFILIQAVITFLIKDLIPNGSAYGVLLLFTSTVAISVYLFRTLEKKWLMLIYAGFIIRIGILLIDLYVPAIPIFSSGDDSEYFHAASVAISEGLLPVSEGRTAYVPFLSGIYFLVGDQRPFAQFLNVAFWVFAAVYLLKSLKLMNIEDHLIFWALLIFSFMPNSMFMSGILLRESIIIFFISLSLYWFVRWIRSQGFSHFAFAVILSLLATIFHSGMIGFAVAYMLAFVLIPKPDDKKGLNITAPFLYLLFLSGLVFVLMQNQELFLEKFSALEEKGVSNLDLSGRGGSIYLTSFSGLSGWMVYAVAPIKMFYFLLSPLPMDWRGLTDMISFLFDSSFYLVLSAMIIIGMVRSQLPFRTKLILGVSLFVTVLIYSYGTSNAGTAMRHRNKMIPLYLIVFAVVYSKQAVLLPASLVRRKIEKKNILTEGEKVPYVN